eukprot:2758958-Prymnesium_polylepis.1
MASKGKTRCFRDLKFTTETGNADTRHTAPEVGRSQTWVKTCTVSGYVSGSWRCEEPRVAQGLRRVAHRGPVYPAVFMVGIAPAVDHRRG